MLAAIALKGGASKTTPPGRPFSGRGCVPVPVSLRRQAKNGNRRIGWFFNLVGASQPAEPDEQHTFFSAEDRNGSFVPKI
jgi:hypothetical protein